MPDTTVQGRSWTVEGTRAVLRNGVGGRIDVAHPEDGLCSVTIDKHRLTGQLLRTHSNGYDRFVWPLPVADSYVRGTDLVASYQPSADWPYSPQIYWRANALESIDGLIGSLSLLVSVQTHLLETHPQVAVTTHLEADEVWQLMPGSDNCIQVGRNEIHAAYPTSPGMYCVLVRLTHLPVSYCEFMRSSDFNALDVANDGTGSYRINWALFGEFLEKGVIRRARAFSAFLPRTNDLELAAACCDMLKLDSLPLTT